MVEDRTIVNKSFKKFVKNNQNIAEIWTYDPKNWDNPLEEPEIEIFLRDDCLPTSELLQDLYARTDGEPEIWNSPVFVKNSDMHIFRTSFKNPNYVCIYRNGEWLNAD